METKNIIKALSALAQESRLAIFRTLVEAGPEGLNVGAIAEALDLPSATLSFHLKELSNADLVTSRPESRFIIYSVNFETMTNLITYLTENCCGGRQCAPASFQKPKVKRNSHETPTRTRRR